MDQPELFSTANGLSRNAASEILDLYFDLTVWKKAGETAADVGCGTGDVTAEILFPFFPKNVKRLVGLDISESMVRFASTQNKNAKIHFDIMDVAAPKLLPAFKDHFDHVFSFICLHWVLDQKKAFENIFDMLKSDGDVLAAFFPNTCFFDAYEILLRKDKWKPYLSDMYKYVGPYRHVPHPERDLRKVLENVGFEVDVCAVTKHNYVYPNLENLMATVQAVSPFYKNLPVHLRYDYMAESLEAYKELNIVEEYHESNTVGVNVEYDLLVVVAHKS